MWCALLQPMRGCTCGKRHHAWNSQPRLSACGCISQRAPGRSSNIPGFAGRRECNARTRSESIVERGRLVDILRTNEAIPKVAPHEVRRRAAQKLCRLHGLLMLSRRQRGVRVPLGSAARAIRLPPTPGSSGPTRLLGRLPGIRLYRASADCRVWALNPRETTPSIMSRR
jgi:hypothetical protein